jgi:hypothetical protein
LKTLPSPGKGKCVFSRFADRDLRGRPGGSSPRAEPAGTSKPRERRLRAHECPVSLLALYEIRATKSKKRNGKSEIRGNGGRSRGRTNETPPAPGVRNPWDRAPDGPRGARKARENKKTPPLGMGPLYGIERPFSGLRESPGKTRGGAFGGFRASRAGTPRRRGIVPEVTRARRFGRVSATRPSFFSGPVGNRNGSAPGSSHDIFL